ncbi:WD40-repeat-containing domain protein [Lipomyces arxii]|uniref:WD40-repeat-containing domain protein n=1 Tax=Lipomyces arxii TaxID=56418 RepID=UPI0034CE52E8
MISSTTWVPRGFAAEFPVRYEVDDAEVERISELAQMRLDDAIEDYDEAREKDVNDEDGEEENDDDEVEIMVDEETADVTVESGNEEDELKEYDLENYDKPTDSSLSMFTNIKSLSYYGAGEVDPYITLPKKPDGQDYDEDEEEEREELQVYGTDNLLLVTKTQDNLSQLEVYVYDEPDKNLYVHHDILLPSFPLCVEWLDVRVGRTRTADDTTGSFAAVGTFEPTIEIWNLDVVDGMYPDAILGSTDPDVVPEKKTKKGKKTKKTKKANEKYHVDAVLALSANRQHRSLLASGSADKTIKLWDLTALQCARSYGFHTDKVCSLAWHPEEGSVLLTGSYDRSVVASDMRAPEAEHRRWGVDADVETVKWDPHESNYFYVSTESGRVYYYDARTAPASVGKSKPVWTLQAHDSEVSTMDVNSHVKGLIATGSTDQTVKLWNVADNKPSLVSSRDIGVGRVFSVSWLPDKEAGRTLAVGGSNGVVQVWDTKKNDTVRAAADEDDQEEDEDEDE